MEVTIEINNDWGGGYCANVLLENTGSSAVVWSVEFTIEGTIASMWNGSYTQQGSTVQLEGSGWNSTIQPGSFNPSIGFCANR